MSTNCIHGPEPGTRELGTRVALGATKADILREVLAAGSKPVLRGLFAAMLIPARRGARGDPMKALHYE